jgi:hypothetical protein
MPGEQVSLEETCQINSKKNNLPKKSKSKKKCIENYKDNISIQASNLEKPQIVTGNNKNPVKDNKDHNQILPDTSQLTEEIKIQSIDVIKPVRKINKRYQELLQNSLLIFDKPKKKTFSVIKDSDEILLNNAEKILGGFEAKLVKDLNLDAKELAFNLKFTQTDSLIKRKAAKSSQIKFKKSIDIDYSTHEKNFAPGFFSKIPQNILFQDLYSIYNEVTSLRLIGRKRQSDFSILEKENLIKKSDNLIFEFPHIQKTIISNETIKNNFLNKDIESLIKNKIQLVKDPSYKSNKYFSFGEFLPNAYEKSIRRDYANSLDFIQQFNEDYKPIQMQKENENLFQSDVNSICTDYSTNKSSQMNNLNSNSKTHFIKKKQSAVNIKRQCGVSYVVASESRQKDVENKYAPLGHLVYQGTYSIPLISEDSIIQKIYKLIEKELMNKPLLVTYFETHEEDEMKEYLLFKEKRLKIAKNILIIQSLDDIWKFSKDRHFLCIHLLLDEIQGIRNYTQKELENLSNKSLLSKSDIQIGIIFRKATSGIKSVLKLYKNGGLDIEKHKTTFNLANITPLSNIDETIEKLSGTNMPTLSMRIELYVGENQWKESNLFSKQILFSFMSLIEEKIISLILNWNENRLLVNSLAKLNESYHLNTLIYCKKPKAKIKKAYSERGHILEEDKFEIKEIFNSTNEIKNASEDKVLKQIVIVNFQRENFLFEKNEFEDNFFTINNLLEKGLIINFTQEEFRYHPFFTINYNNSPLPMYIISTRDCFVFDLVVKEEILNYQNRQIIRKEFFFDENNVPSNFHKFKLSNDDLRVGVVTYENFFTNEELSEIEKDVEKTEELSLKEAYLPETAQKTFGGDKLKRTKFFFGSRYMWTKKQLAEPNSYVAAGIRRDVSPAPYWMKEKIEYPLVESGIIKKNFINSFALNVYHDGTEGLGQHFDDAVRFKQVSIK